MEFEFSGEIVKNTEISNFMINTLSGTRVFPRGRRDRQTDRSKDRGMMKLFLILRTHVKRTAV